MKEETLKRIIEKQDEVIQIVHSALKVLNENTEIRKVLCEDNALSKILLKLNEMAEPIVEELASLKAEAEGEKEEVKECTHPEDFHYKRKDGHIGCNLCFGIIENELG